MNSTLTLKPRFTINQAHVRLSAARPVRVQALTVDREVLPHDHDYYEICLVRRGSGVHRTELYEERLEAGSVVVIPPGKVHAFSNIKLLEVTNIYYLAEWLLVELTPLWETDGLVPLFLAASLFRRNVPMKVPQFSLTEAGVLACTRELNDIHAELQLDLPSRVYLKSSFLKCLVGLSRAYVKFTSQKLLSPVFVRGVGETPIPSAIMDSIGFGFRPEIQRALEHVEECISESQLMNVEKLARHSHLSQDHLSRLFKQATGYSPLEFYQRRRIHQASALLLNPHYSVTEVGYRLRYADTAHLSRFFKRYMGIPPREYRQKYLPRCKPSGSNSGKAPGTNPSVK